MADNVIANAGAGGSTFRAFQESVTLVDWPANVAAYITGGSAGAWTLQQVDATHGLPVSVLGTVPISAASLPLPTGAATSAKQPALGTAGAASADVLTVQGIAAMTPLKVDGSGVTQPISGTVTANAGTGTFNVADASLELAQASTTLGQKGPLVQGAVTTAAPAYTTAQTSPLSLNTSGGLRVDGSGVTQPVSGTVTANAGTGSFTVVQATAANLNATVTGTVTANVGTTNGLALDATLTGGTLKAIPVAGTSGGATAAHLVSAASTNATSTKASAGTVYSVQCFNTNASPRYLKFFDKATAPVLGTDVPIKVIMMPGNASGAGATATFPVGVNFANGIAFAITGGIADADATAVGLNDCVINFDYK